MYSFFIPYLMGHGWHKSDFFLFFNLIIKLETVWFLSRVPLSLFFLKTVNLQEIQINWRKICTRFEPDFVNTQYMPSSAFPVALFLDFT